jgi:glycolate oxidase FAD binding subunit
MSEQVFVDRLAPIGARLVAALGREAVFLHEPRAVEGALLEATLRPSGGEALACALRLLSEEALPALVRGGGTRLATANAPCRARVLLETQALAEPAEIDADEGVARFAAGAKLSALRGALAGSGWELPLDPPGGSTTLGGALAAAAQGPRFASPRDVVLGLGVVLASGERIRCGGRVVKNVTGYDLAKLFVGSYGTLGVIEWAWLRLRPTPESTRVCVAPLGLGAAADAAALAAARRPTVRAAALLDAALYPEPLPAGAARALVVELAGDAAAVEQDAAVLASTAGAGAADDTAVEALRAAQAAGPLRVRVAALPTSLPAAAELLRAGGGAVLAYPARGLLWARFALEGPDDERGAERALRAAREAVHAAHGVCLLEAAPLAARVGREVFSGAVATLALERAVKRQYDPAGILNPGRFVGGL